MALKYELDSLDGVDESLASHYTKREDGKFVLAFDGSDPVAGAVNAKNHEKQARQAAEQKITELTNQVTTLNQDLSNAKFELEKAGGPAGKTEAYERKIAELTEQLTAKNTELETVKQQSEQSMSEYVAGQYLDRLVSEVGVSPAAVNALKKIYNGSVVAEKGEDGYKQAFMIDGKPAVMTEQEFRTRIATEYPELVKGSPASGAGAGNATPNGSAGTQTNAAAEQAKQNKDLTGFLGASLNI